MTQQEKLKEQYGAFFDRNRLMGLWEITEDVPTWIIDHIPQLLEDWSQAKFDAALVEEKQNLEKGLRNQWCLKTGWNDCRSEILKRWNSQE